MAFLGAFFDQILNKKTISSEFSLARFELLEAPPARFLRVYIKTATYSIR